MKTCPNCTFPYDELKDADCPRCSIAAGEDGANDPLGGPAPDPVPEEPQADEPPAHEPPGGGWDAQDELHEQEEQAHSDGPRSILGQLDDLRKSGVFTIALIGFFVGGKTWFLNRLKYELDEKPGYDVDPPYAPPGKPVERTNTIEIHHVRCFNEKEEKVEVFAIVDIPGENLYPLVEHQYGAAKDVISAIDMCGAVIVALPSDEVLLAEQVAKDLRELRSPENVLAVLAEAVCGVVPHDPENCNEALCRVARDAKRLCRQWGGAAAFVLRNEAIGAEIRQLDEQRAAKIAAARPSFKNIEALSIRIERLEAQRQALLAVNRIIRLGVADEDLRQFTRYLASLSGLTSMLSHEGRPVISTYPFETITKEKVNNHINISGHFKRFARPVFVALTKADLISSPDPLTKSIIERKRRDDLGNMFDDDPIDTVRLYRSSLPARLKQWFRYTKMDFVTAFSKHLSGDPVIDYNSSHYGINTVFDWIFWAQGWPQRTPGEVAALNRAVRLRDLRDADREEPGFRIPALRRAS